MTAIRIEGVTKEFPGGVQALGRTDLEISEGEFMVLVGPSGCGKSTLLRIIAGLEQPSSGRVFIGDRDVTDLSPRERDIAMVFQNYALYPHMTVRQNLGFGLRVRNVNKSAAAARVLEVAELLGLETLLERKPAELSGGQRQRVAMGRAIVREPMVYLLDEPLSNLDAKLRVSMRAELARLHERLGVTTLYVTHDQTEAMTLGQRVAVLKDGLLQQCESPRQLFARPANVFVASFIGTPPMNLVEATVQDGHACFGPYRLPVHSGVAVERGRTVLGIRPTAFSLAEQPASAATMRVRIEVVEMLGTDANVIFRVRAARIDSDNLGAGHDRQGPADDRLLADEDALFVARLPGDSTFSPGDEATLAVDTRQLHFFDPASGQRLVDEATNNVLAHVR